MEFENTDASVESSTTTPAAGQERTPSQATTQPAAPDQQPAGFHQHPDWQRMVASRREDRAMIQTLRGEIQRLTQTVQQRQAQSPDAPLTQEEQAAITTLKRLMARDPELAAALGVSKQMPQFQTRMQAFDQSEARAAQAHIAASKSFVKDLAAEYGLSTDDASLKHIMRLVAG